MSGFAVHYPGKMAAVIGPDSGIRSPEEAEAVIAVFTGRACPCGAPTPPEWGPTCWLCGRGAE